MPLRLGNRKADGNHVEKRGLRQIRVPLSEILADMKAQFVSADTERTACNKRLVGAAVGVRHRFQQERRGARADLVESNADTGRRLAGLRVEYMSGKPAVDAGDLCVAHELHKAQPRDQIDLLQRGRDLRSTVVVQATLARFQNGVARLAAHADDKRETEFLRVGGVQFFEARELGWRQAVEAERALLRFRGLSEIVGQRRAPREVGVTADQFELLGFARRRGRRRHGVEQRAGALEGPHGIGALGHPGRVLINFAQRAHEFGLAGLVQLFEGDRHIDCL